MCKCPCCDADLEIKTITEVKMNYRKAYEELTRMIKAEVRDTEVSWPHKNRTASVPTETLKAIGNGQVPLTAVAAWHMLRGRIK